ncbi:aspartyl protease family protein [Pinirhizobacter sp.]|jgi:predicted aspartyl protease|uniref:aspartyl protease family protein n=1 Tax=Pinirhizobacter sp. TaxID=2950432 RepID=UPI002F41480F
MDAVIRLPFSVVDGRVYVEARVNGRGPYRFAVDTGASGMGRLDASMLATLGLHPSDRAATSDAVKTVEVETTHLDSLSLGSLERKDLDVITRDYKKQATGDAAFDGILGRAFFSDGLLVIDYGRRQITFSTASRLSRDDSDALSYERAFRVPVRINGKLFEANIDTGANVSMVVPSHMWSGISSAPLERSGTGQLSNTKIETSQGVVAGSVELSAVVLKDVDAKVSDRFPEILIGAHLMASSILAIDQRSNTIAVCPI